MPDFLYHNQMSKRIVFFDLDGTILGGMNSERSFFFYLIRKRHIGLKHFLKYWIFILKWLPKYKLKIFVQNKAYLAGMRKSKIKKLAEEYVNKKLLKKIKPLLVNKIKQHRENNDILVLLTGTPHFIAKVFAKHLNIDHIEPTYCVIENDYFTNLPPTQNPFAEEKLTIAKRVCQQYQADMKDCFAYANSIYDAALLSAVGHAIAVNPDLFLHRLAKKNGWKIIY